MEVHSPEEQKPSPFEAIVGTKTFLDKTGMIQKIISGPRCIHITAPPLFGKTTNLDMLRKFFEVNTEFGRRVSKKSTSNYALFVKNRLDISRDAGSMEHFGTHLVVYLDFKCNRNFQTFMQMERFCLHVIHKAFKQHEYLRYNSGIPNKGEVDDWCDIYSWRSYTACEVLTGLPLLLLSLMSHHNPTIDIMVLVDDLDAPLLCLIRSQRHKWPTSMDTYNKCKELYFNMLTKLTTFEYPIRIIFSGTFRTRSTLLYEDQHPYDFLSDEKYTPFYGATSLEVQNLLNKFEVLPHFKSKVSNAFGGYVSKYGKHEMYHLNGVLMFLNHYEHKRNFDFDFATINFDLNLQHVLIHSQPQNIMWQLRKKLEVHCNNPFSWPDTVVSLLETVHNFQNSCIPQNPNMEKFPVYLLQLGYVSYARPTAPRQREESCCALCRLNPSRNRETEHLGPSEFTGPCLIDIPNNRARKQMKEFLFDFYSSTFSFSLSDLKECRHMLINLSPYSDQEEFEQFRNSLWRLFQTKYFSQKDASAHLAFYPVASSTCRYFHVERGNDVNSKTVFLFRHGSEICIRTHTKGNNAVAALKEAQYVKMTRHGEVNPIREIVCIGINVVPCTDGIQGVRVDMKCELSRLTTLPTIRESIELGATSPVSYLNIPIYSS